MKEAAETEEAAALMEKERLEAEEAAIQTLKLEEEAAKLVKEEGIRLEQEAAERSRFEDETVKLR
jgi:hypothetical protein